MLSENSSHETDGEVGIPSALRRPAKNAAGLNKVTSQSVLSANTSVNISMSILPGDSMNTTLADVPETDQRSQLIKQR